MNNRHLKTGLVKVRNSDDYVIQKSGYSDPHCRLWLTLFKKKYYFGPLFQFELRNTQKQLSIAQTKIFKKIKFYVSFIFFEILQKDRFYATVERRTQRQRKINLILCNENRNHLNTWLVWYSDDWNLSDHGMYDILNGIWLQTKVCGIQKIYHDNKVPVLDDGPDRKYTLRCHLNTENLNCAIS